ncbi:DUF4232 domain-containing protein [Blastococcus sp. LR1]|uniref:DUF4232 domain-containing protein n=1 Tax=Blastococcus sp. LR1 TaxID=2877000 RepID=UPI001CCEFC07|nr:DUF4232 domain-containing protein [Blastococcus sp. LR1]MCA0144285.1 DUF4232 domain-containing protein [Blastococcus sp. LR1]
MRDRLRLVAVAGTLLGLGVMVAAAVRASSYIPFLDSEPPCVRSSGGCPADLDAALRGLWWQAGAGGVLVLVGVVLVVVALPHRAREGSRLAQHPVVHAVAAGVTSVPLMVVGSYPALLLLFTGGAHGLPALAAGAWLGQAAALAALDRRLGRADASPRGTAVGGLIVSALGIGATLGVLLLDGAPLGFWALLLTDGITVALGVLLVRLASDPWPVDPRGRLRRGAAVCAALAVGPLGVVALVADQDRDPVPPAASRPIPAPPSLEPPVPVPAPPPPAPTAAPEPAPVAADDPCGSGDLSFTVTGIDGAMGARATSIVARNVGAVPCWVEGQPVVALVQGGRPLTLTVEPGRTPSGDPAPVRRVGLAPGGAAYALLTWRSYGGWADQETPQSMTVALTAAAQAVPVQVADGSPAPFDIADGGTWAVAPWAPPWN